MVSLTGGVSFSAAPSPHGALAYPLSESWMMGGSLDPLQVCVIVGGLGGPPLTADKEVRIFLADPVLQQRLAKYLVLQCVRNSTLEDLHAGIAPSSVSGDYSAVTVTSPHGAIPLPRVSRLNDDEMRRLMIDVVDRTYRFIHTLFDENADGELLLRLAQHDPVPQWNEPELRMANRQNAARTENTGALASRHVKPHADAVSALIFCVCPPATCPTATYAEGPSPCGRPREFVRLKPEHVRGHKRRDAAASPSGGTCTCLLCEDATLKMFLDLYPQDCVVLLSSGRAWLSGAPSNSGPPLFNLSR